MKSREHEPFTDNWFTKEEKEMLLELFRMYAPSGQEECVANYVSLQLTNLGIKFTRDKNNNIYNFDNIGKPLLSAHMDCVGKEECGWYINFVNIFPYGKDEIMKGMGNIGGDDKCGVFLILLILRNHPDFNFCFSVGEEVGGVEGIKSIDFKKMKEDGITDNIPYALILDRRNMGDIICVQNSYGSKEFDEALSLVGKEFGYKSERGSVSDANTISEYINCANLSVAYHNAHTKTEFVSLMGMKNTLNYIEACFEFLDGKEFKLETKVPIVPVTPPATYYGNNGYDYEEDYQGKTWYGGSSRKDYNYASQYCHKCKTYVRSAEFNYTKRICKECEKDQFELDKFTSEYDPEGMGEIIDFSD
jgi:hypothetical protein